MARPIPAVGSVIYNGYTFPAPLECKIRSQVIYDTADRARKYVIYTITIECIIVSDDAPQAAAGAATDVNLTEIRKKLQTPNKPFTFTDQGFGSLSVDGDNVVDSRFGPKPLVLAWEPVGSNFACRVVWVCEVTIPECSDSTLQYDHAFAEFTYQNSWTINESGMTTRTMRATLEVPIDTNGNQITDTADQYLSYFNPPVPDGFWRSRHRDESRGKNVLDITIIDTEIPSDNPYLQGAVKCECSHRVNSVDLGFIEWENTIRGSFEAGPGVNRGQLWTLFQGLVQARRNKGNNVPITVKGLKAGGVPKTSTTYIKFISIEESIFTRSIDFEISWVVIGVGLTDFYKNNGFFTATETNWNLWKTSLANIFDPRGIAQMESKASDDLIVDLCAFAYPPITSEVTKAPRTDAPSIYSNDCPPQESSYLKYDNNFTLEFSHNTIKHQRLIEINEDSIKSASAYPEATSYDLTLPLGVTDSLPYSPGDAHKIQMRGGANTKLIMSGHAERLCYPVTPPKLVSVGGKQAYQTSYTATPYVKVVSDKTPIHGMYWRIEYELNEIPEGNFVDSLVTSGGPENYGNGQ